VTTEHVPITWYDGGPLEQKTELVAAAIDRAHGKRVVIIGESAGATLALHAASHPAVVRVITLCGVTRPDTPVSNYLRRRAPALDTAVRTLPKSFDTDVHSIRAVADGVVNKRYSVAPGAKAHVMWTVGHLMTIALSLTCLAPIVAAIAKKP
jgi:pimeloyl-ACP methyl ester carboxylesterase